jgi:hypothetical protein
MLALIPSVLVWRLRASSSGKVMQALKLALRGCAADAVNHEHVRRRRPQRNDEGLDLATCGAEAAVVAVGMRRLAWRLRRSV